MTYCDTSVLLRQYTQETAAQDARAYLADGHPSPLVSSLFTRAEVLRNARRLSLDVQDVRAFLDERVTVAPLTASQTDLAAELPSPNGVLTAADALHIAVALDVEEDVFVTYDLRQAQAAARAGLDVTSPGLAAGWYLAT